MFEHLEKIREKSPRQKRLYAFAVAFAFSGFILLIWYISIVPGFIEEGKRDKKVKDIASSPSESFATVLKGGMNLFKEQSQAIKEKINSVNLNNINPPAYFKGTTTEKTQVLIQENE